VLTSYFFFSLHFIARNISLPVTAQTVANGDPLQAYASVQPYAGIGNIYIY